VFLSFNGKRLDLTTPKVMGILNLTPDSFFSSDHLRSVDNHLMKAEQMLKEGASIIDLGAVSTRPGAPVVPEKEEFNRLVPSLKAIRQRFPEAFLSIDTFRHTIARQAVDLGADMINDVYGGRFEDDTLKHIAQLGVPYILMHMKGTPDTMQLNPQYQDVVAEIAYFFLQQTRKLRELGASQVVIDPGFGFGKTVSHNFEILDRLQELTSMGFPLVTGVSRKSFIQKTLSVEAMEALNGTTVLHTIALLKGAKILRVHDVREAVEVVKLVEEVNK